MSMVTFSRKSRNKGDGGGSDASTVSTYITGLSVLTPVAESPGVEQDENAAAAPASTAKTGDRPDGGAGPPAPRWRRKNAGERQEAERRQHLAEMRAYFQEARKGRLPQLAVDAFELAVETPPAAGTRGEVRPADAARTPGADGQQPRRVARALAAAAPTPGTAQRQRAMALGMSRRRSSAVGWQVRSVLASSTKAAPHPSPLKLTMPQRAAQELLQDGQAVRRGTLPPPAPHRLSVAADNGDVAASPGGPSWAVNRHSLATRGRRSSLAPGRLSSNGGVLSRLSLGLTDALQWLGIRGRVPAAAAAGGGEGAGSTAAADGGFADRPALSPIASPGVDEAGASTAGGSPLHASTAAVTALEQQPATDDAGSAACSAAAPTAAGGDASPAASAPAPTPTAGQGAQLGASRAAEPPPGEEGPEQLAEQLAAKLRLQGAAEEAGQALAAAERQAAPSLPAERQPLATPAKSGAAAAEEEGDVELSPLQQLLVLCGQQPEPELLPGMDELLGQHVDLKQVRKIGEGTFGEAFKAGGVVLKIVPMAGSVLVNGEPQKRAEEILAEVAVTLTLSRLNGGDAAPGEAPPNVTSGFVETFGVGICRGGYSPALLREWHRWDEEHESENEPVDCFQGLQDQLFVVFVVADGGADLEHFELRSFHEVRSILLQTALTVAVAEEACQFEHRDLHWGNLLIRRGEAPAPTASVAARLRGVELEAATGGVTVTLIDFTLSRLVTVTGEVAFCDLAADPELFKGPKGSVQAETYRRMKKATKNRWQAHVPATNVFWMQYLVDTCMAEKKGWGGGKEELAELRAFKRRASGCASCAELLLDDFLRPGLLIKD